MISYGKIIVFLHLFFFKNIFKQLNIPPYFVIEQGQHLHGRIDLRLAVQQEILG